MLNAISLAVAAMLGAGFDAPGEKEPGDSTPPEVQVVIDVTPPCTPNTPEACTCKLAELGDAVVTLGRSDYDPVRKTLKVQLSIDLLNSGLMETPPTTLNYVVEVKDMAGLVRATHGGTVNYPPLISGESAAASVVYTSDAMAIADSEGRMNNQVSVQYEWDVYGKVDECIENNRATFEFLTSSSSILPSIIEDKPPVK